MTLDEILTEYEDLWRKAAFEDAKQMNVNDDAPGPWRSCAWLAAEEFGRKELCLAAELTRVRWRGRNDWLANAMATVNNQDKWTWDMFANKFRDLVSPAEVPEAAP